MGDFGKTNYRIYRNRPYLLFMFYFNPDYALKMHKHLTICKSIWLFKLKTTAKLV
jgi:hypothetical protein